MGALTLCYSLLSFLLSFTLRLSHAEQMFYSTKLFFWTKISLHQEKEPDGTAPALG